MLVGIGSILAYAGAARQRTATYAESMVHLRREGSSRGATVRITSARTPRSQDIASRQRRYLFSMAVRTVCFLLAVVTDGWLRWAFIIAAFVLPYLAVVMANAGARPDPGGPAPFVKNRRRSLPPGS